MPPPSGEGGASYRCPQPLRRGQAKRLRSPDTRLLYTRGGSPSSSDHSAVQRDSNCRVPGTISELLKSAEYGRHIRPSTNLPASEECPFDRRAVTVMSSCVQQPAERTQAPSLHSGAYARGRRLRAKAKCRPAPDANNTNPTPPDTFETGGLKPPNYGHSLETGGVK